MTVKYSTRRGSIDDLELIRLFHRESMRPHIEAQTGFWDEEAQRRRMLASDPEAHEIIEVDGRSVGCCLVRTTDEAIRLVRMYLLPSYQGLGIGSAILRDLCDRADDCLSPIILRILKVNPAKRLYENFGFETTDETDTHYHMIRQPVSAIQKGNANSKAAMGRCC